MPPSQPQEPVEPAPALAPATPPPAPMPPPPPPVPVPPVPPKVPTPPMADMAMPKTRPAPAAPAIPAPVFIETHHSHTGAFVSGALLIGLILGAAAGYWGGKFQMMMEQTAQQIQNTQAQTQDQAQTDATASTYSQVNTNPMQGVQTNPFQ